MGLASVLSKGCAASAWRLLMKTRRHEDMPVLKALGGHQSGKLSSLEL